MSGTDARLHARRNQAACSRIECRVSCSPPHGLPLHSPLDMVAALSLGRRLLTAALAATIAAPPDGLRSFGAAPPAVLDRGVLGNLTGTFVGNWSLLAESDASFFGASPTNGSLHLGLDTHPSQVPEVEDVRGNLVLFPSPEAGAEDRLPDHSAANQLRLVVDGGVLLHRPSQDSWAELRLQLSSSMFQNVSDDDDARARGRAARGGLFRDDTLVRRCHFSFEGKVSAVWEELPRRAWGGQPSVEVSGRLASQECSLAVWLEASLLRRDEMTEKANSVALMSTGTALMLISLTARQLEAAASGAALARLSFATVAHLAILDANASLLHLSIGFLSEELFGSFAFAAFCYLLLFSGLDMRLVGAVFRSRLPPNATTDEIRSALRNLQFQLYGAMVCLTISFAALGRFFPGTLLLLAHSFFVAQIRKSYMDDAPRPLLMRYVWISSAARLLAPLYLLLCPRNVLKMEPRPVLAAALVLWVGGQAACLQAQHSYGARCFLPPSWRPPKYDYRRPATAAERTAAGWGPVKVEGDAEGGGGEGGGRAECPICAEALPWEPVGEKGSSNRMLTPCAHFFHVACLSRWLVVKLEWCVSHRAGGWESCVCLRVRLTPLCHSPTCRGALPLP